jgi:hypothetical protein
MSEIEREHGPAGPWSGWVTFAALLLVLLGLLNVVQGLLALFDHGYFVASGKELVLVSYKAWGVVLILWGVVLAVVGGGLNGRREWARWAAAIVVIVDVVFQVGFFPSSPLLSLILITLDVIVLYALTAKWEEAQAGV